MPSGVANEWMQGINLGANIMGSRLDRDARMQELKSRDAARRAEEQRAAQLMDLKIQEYEMQLQKRADVEKAGARFNLLRSPFIPTSSGTWVPNPHQMDEASAMMTSFLPLAETPDQAAKIVHEANLVRDRSFTPRVVDVPNGSGTVKFGYTSRNSGQFMSSDAPETTVINGVEYFRSSPSQQWRKVPDDILGRQLSKSEHDLALKNLDLSIQDPNDPRRRIIPPENMEEAKKRNSMNPAVRTDIEKMEATGDTVASLTRDLMAAINPSTAGVGGMFQRTKESVLGQMGMPVKGSPATVAASINDRMNAMLTRLQKSDGNIAEPERKQMQKGFPNLRDWTQSPQQTMDLTVNVLEDWGNRSRRNAVKLGKPITPMWLTKEEILGALSRHEISEAQANAWMEDNVWEMTKSFGGYGRPKQ